GVFAAAATMDREFCRTFARADGLPVVPHAVLRPGEELTGEQRAGLGLPVLVRPGHVVDGDGTLVTDWAELEAARPGGGEVFLDGIDPMPELSDGGVFARMWAADGLSYTELVSSLIESALRRGTSLR